ncbi:DUF1932 domain-containing protein [Pusillimonas noertemannii]|uniref:3-hydroxyisobutyrate dehydrogenase-like beta-hydroxyacid dehydrogenase n=1 Tax=Pusillimonas noertemannii TaxID=305977 RepID=A0A2U1CI54_9BURK|nr:DUF1932 domain-containing protein [Pusillimonas noertemannii]NYT70433.1 NAD(P)-dependent oxidoreductase [Pusillimonas noertemannii]PVY60633.1 3-hydroxyisobutyrate dehydrogenase-like beta-hydroxyacid dehydrogenase [Pusillimonas noertemannii]TFL08643.1 NAD(P)-dependent oxidoreductase [Pusillimonas noertemannii]
MNQATAPLLNTIALVGFGEAGFLLGQGLAEAGATVGAYDIKVHDAEHRPGLEARAQQAGVSLHASLAAAVQDADLVISAVTASSAAQAAVDAAQCLHAGQYFLDINSVSPATKHADRDAIEAAGGFYIESAVMAPVPPYGLKVPMLLGGEHAQALSGSLNELGLRTKAVSTQVGVASAIKMCRSVMIKGLEALTVECMTAARRYGAEEAVLASLNETFPGMGWTENLPHYLISRVAEHGRRRAAEMREVMETLQDVDVTPLMAQATAQSQDALVDAMQAAGLAYDTQRDFVWQELVDQLKKD